jgi:hypothetical protein
MRLFEILLFLLCVTDAAARIRYASDRPIWTTAIPLVSFLFAIIHVAGEGTRWQMIPVYLVVVSSFTMLLARSFRESELSFGGDQLSRSVGILIIGLSVGSLVSATALPVFDLPAPTGHYKVGTVDGEMTESGIVVRFQYPSDNAQGERASYAAGNFDTHLIYLADRFGLLPGWLQHLALVRSFSYPGAALSEELPRYRILIACPDVGIPATQSTILAEELASRGFVVISIPNPSQIDSIDSSAVPEIIITWLETVDRGDRLGWLAERLNFGTVGIYGLGNAGQAAVQASINGSFRAGASVGAQSPVNEPTVPFMYIHPADYPAVIPDNVNHTTYVLTIAGAGVDNFGDDAFISPMMPALGKFGSIAPVRASLIVGDYLGAFFNKHLTRGTVEPILDDDLQKYLEVTFLVHEAKD